MTKPWRIMESTEPRVPCEDCEVVPAELWCDSCGIGLCRECDLQCHDPRGFACSHRRILLVGQSGRKNDSLSGSAGPECKKASLKTEVGEEPGIESEEVGAKDPFHPVPSFPSRERRRKKKKHVKGAVQICSQAEPQHVDQSTSDSASPVLSKCATFPSCRENTSPFEGTTAHSSATEHEELSTSDECSLSSSPKTLQVTRSTSLPSSFKLQSAFRGSHEVQGLGPRPKLHVQWAPGVQEPLSSMISHTVGHKQQSFKKKDQKNRHKGKYTQARSSGKSEKRGKRKLKKEAEPRQLRAAFPATKVASNGDGLEEVFSESVSALHVVDTDQESSNQDSFSPEEVVVGKGNSKASSLPSSLNSDCLNGHREDIKLSAEDCENDLNGKHLHMLEALQETTVLGACSPMLKPGETVNGSLKVFSEHSMVEGMRTLQSLCARRVLPASLLCSESTVVSTYSEQAVACMVHAACLVAEEDTSGALVEFEASARLFRLAEKMARTETSAESEIAAKHALNGQVMAWVAMSTLYAKSGQTSRAEKCHLSLLQACRGSEMKLEAGMCLIDEGQCQLQRGEFKRARAFFEAASALLEGELHTTLEQLDCSEERRSYSEQLREILVKARRLAGVAAFRSSDFDAAKRLLLGTLVVARRLNLKAEEARCLRLLADLQKGSQHLSSLQAAADAMSLIDLPVEHAEALFCLGSCKVTLHLSTLRSTNQGPRDDGLLESAKCDLEEAVTVLQSTRRADDEACNASEGPSVPTLDVLTSSGKCHMVHSADKHGTACNLARAKSSGDYDYVGSSGAVLFGRLFEALGRTCVLMGDFLEARAYFSLALRDKEWAAAFQDAAKQVETLLDTMHWEESRTCRGRWGTVGTSIATGV